MAYTYNIEEIPPDDMPCIEHDIRRAKKFLQKHSPESGDSLYDHLTEVLAKILAERPKNAVDIFEEFSRQMKEKRFKTQTNHLRDLYVSPTEYETAKKLIKLFKNIRDIDARDQEGLGDEEDEIGDARNKKPNMLDLLFYFEQTGIGLPRSEMVLLNLAIRKLMSDAPVENVRFWGKVLGNPKNYYVVEANLQEEELNRRLEKIAAQEEAIRLKEEARIEAQARAAEEEAAAKTQMKADEGATENVEPVEGATEITEAPQEEKKEEPLNLVFPPMPVNLWKPPLEVPAEKVGTGVNAKVYFVCNEPGLDRWIELPAVTPQQIVIARQIVRYCTGNLETTIHSFPPFPGTEKNYLRAQIARISAATQISPIGFFSFGGGDEEEEIGEEIEEGGILSENVHYDPLPVKDLVDPSMSNWCHHAPYILKQGRVTWWNPNRDELDEDIEDEGAEEEEEEADDDDTRVTGVEREISPPLLTPLSEDATLETIIPWTATQSSHIESDLAVALVKSNIWHGAFAFACGRRFANVYIGWSHKYTVYNYSPPPMPPVQDQYRVGPEIMEIQDPTFEQEEAYRIAHLPPPPIIPMGEEEEEMVEEEEEEDDTEEDD